MKPHRLFRYQPREPREPRERRQPARQTQPQWSRTRWHSLPGGHVSLLRLKGLHSSGGGSGKPVSEPCDGGGVSAKRDSTQIPARQQPIESQSIRPGMPVESPQMRPPSQQLSGGSCPGGLVQRHASPAPGSDCVWLTVLVEPPPPSPSTVCEHATERAATRAARARTDFMRAPDVGVPHRGLGASAFLLSATVLPICSDSLDPPRSNARVRSRVVDTRMFRT